MPCAYAKCGSGSRTTSFFVTHWIALSYTFAPADLRVGDKHYTAADGFSVFPTIQLGYQWF